MRFVFSHMAFKIGSPVASFTIELKQWMIKLCQKQNKKALKIIVVSNMYFSNSQRTVRPLVVCPVLQVETSMSYLIKSCLF